MNDQGKIKRLTLKYQIDLLKLKWLRERNHSLRNGDKTAYSVKHRSTVITTHMNRFAGRSMERFLAGSISLWMT